MRLRRVLGGGARVRGRRESAGARTSGAPACLPGCICHCTIGNRLHGGRDVFYRVSRVVSAASRREATRHVRTATTAASPAFRVASERAALLRAPAPTPERSAQRASLGGSRTGGCRGDGTGVRERALDLVRNDCAGGLLHWCGHGVRPKWWAERRVYWSRSLFGTGLSGTAPHILSPQRLQSSQTGVRYVLVDSSYRSTL